MDNNEQQENVDTGLSYNEYSIIYHLVQAWNLYLKLDNQNGNDTEDFRKCIHRLERIMAIRHMRREYPNFWIQPIP